MKLILLKDAKLGNYVLIESTQGYGLCLCKIKEQQEYPHGFELINIKTSEYEFQHFEYDNYQQTVCCVLDDNEQYDVRQLHEQA